MLSSLSVIQDKNEKLVLLSPISRFKVRLFSSYFTDKTCSTHQLESLSPYQQHYPSVLHNMVLLHFSSCEVNSECEEVVQKVNFEFYTSAILAVHSLMLISGKKTVSANMMATAIQENGINSLSNGNLSHKVDEQNSSSPSEQSESIVKSEETTADNSETPEIDIVINNVVCSFSVRCHLNLRQIALNGSNVEYRRENGMITMKLRKPYTTASMWSSGKITCTGATSEPQAKVAARRYARCLQKLGFKTKFNNFRVVNVLGTCSMPFAIKITAFSERFKEHAEYEPELHPGVTYKLYNPKATLKIFSTGSITVTAPSVADVQAAIEHIFPLVYEFRKERTKEDILALQLKQRGVKRKRSFTHIDIEEQDYEEHFGDTSDEENYGSDESWD
ncbi:TATA box-binding protein-like protein 1 [Gryllus bimaculatus]|nr:TATA box-binding protein-like protein 1 [Gryllus bimaculatus]